MRKSALLWNMNTSHWKEFTWTHHTDIQPPMIVMQREAVTARQEFVQAVCMNCKHRIFFHMLA